MSRRDEAITIKVDNYEKTKYRHWCIDNTGGNMSAALRLLVQCVIENGPTWAQVKNALCALKRVEG